MNIMKSNSSYMQLDSNLFAQNRALKIGFVIVVAWMIWMSWSIHALGKDRQTAVLPPFSNKEWVLTTDNANDPYLTDMSLYIVQLLGTWNPGSVEEQLNQLLSLVHPDAYNKYRDQFREISKRANRYASVSFSSQWNAQSPIKRTGDMMSISVTRRRISGSRVSRSEQVNYEIHFSIENGRFWVTDIGETINDDELKADAT